MIAPVSFFPQALRLELSFRYTFVMRAAFLSILFFSSIGVVQAQEPVPLWSGEPPGALGREEKDNPTITPFLANTTAAAPAMIIFPGGGYGSLAPYEGKGYADWLVTNGISCFVIKYRLGTGGYRHPSMLQDAARAVRLVRARAEDWRIDPKRVGVIGSSAGGHLVSTLITHFDSGKAEAIDPVERQSSRPDLAILCYPVITMRSNTHTGSKRNLLGENPNAELVKELSNELHVTKDTPPCFIWHTWEDKTVKLENALEFAAALQRADVPFDLHVYQKGSHGLGLGNHHPWTQDCLYWLREYHFVK